MKLELEVPQAALDAISQELAKHNVATGAEISLVPYLERHVLELAGTPALQAAIPALEQDRDEGFQAAIKARQTAIIQGFQDVPS